MFQISETYNLYHC